MNIKGRNPQVDCGLKYKNVLKKWKSVYCDIVQWDKIKVLDTRLQMYK